MSWNLVPATLLLFASSALAAPPVPAPEWTPEARLTLARTLVGEADFHRPDHAAMAHVLAKRWHIARRGRRLADVPFERFVRMYSALWKPSVDTRRARAIRALPWAPVGRHEAGGWGGRRWDRVRHWVERWGRGEVSDPCPRALHWGGTMDRPMGHWRPVDCGQTRNLFYRVQRRGGDS